MQTTVTIFIQIANTGRSKHLFIFKLDYVNGLAWLPLIGTFSKF